MNLRNAFSIAINAKGRAIIGIATVTFSFASASLSLGVVDITETFDIGTGTRFDLFLGNDISRPKPATLVPAENPADSDLINDPFAGQRTFADGGGNIITNHFGLTTTNNAGGLGAGEFGGEFNWFDYGGVADTTLGGQLNHSDEVTISATMRLDDIGFDNDQRITLGYYNLPAGPVVDDFSRGNVSAGIGFVGGARFLLQINGNNSGAINVPGGFDPDTGQTAVFDVDLTLKFDPEQGEDGLAWFEGTVAGIPINQFTFSNPADADHPFSAFAISQSFLREQQDAYRRGVAWIDDLTYSVVSDLGIDTPDPDRIAPSNADFDGDDDVDGADFLIWQRGFGVGATLAQGDANGDGMVDGVDLGVWQTQYGTSPLVANLAAVPEPTSLVLLSLIGIVVSNLRMKCFR